MRKQHFEYVYAHFKEHLDLYHQANREYFTWFENLRISDLRVVVDRYGHGWCISAGGGLSVFVEIPTKEEAKDILQFIKDTETTIEVLFL